MTDNKIVAAHLASALVAKSTMKEFNSEMAVKRFNEVLNLLDEQDAARTSQGIDDMIKAF